MERLQPAARGANLRWAFHECDAMRFSLNYIEIYVKLMQVLTYTLNMHIEDNTWVLSPKVSMGVTAVWSVSAHIAALVRISSCIVG